MTFVNNGNLDIAVLWSEANISDNIQFDGSRNYEGVIKSLMLKANSISTTRFTVPIGYGISGPNDKELFIQLYLSLVDGNANSHSIFIPILSVVKREDGQSYGSDQSYFKIIPSDEHAKLNISQDGQPQLERVSQ